MKNREYTLEADTKSFEFGVLFVRLFRSLDAIVGGDARAWLFNPNLQLGGTPAEQIRTITGLMSDMSGAQHIISTRKIVDSNDEQRVN